MADSRERGPSREPTDGSAIGATDGPAGETAEPPLRARAVGGLQWAITGSYVFLLGFLLFAWYLRYTRTSVSLDASWAFAGFVAAAFVAGFVWVGVRSAGPEARGRRVEIVVTLLVLGFLLPFAAPRLLDAFGVARPVPFFGFGAAYALTLALSYGLVYGLGVRFFFPPKPSDPERPE